MKKLLALVVTVVTAVAFCFGMTGCKKNDDSSASNAAVITVPKYEENVPTVAINSDFKVGFIFLHDEKSTYDLNFINAAKEACNYFGLKDDQVLTKKNIPETNDCYDAAEQLVSAGCKVIFADSFGHEDYIMKSAKQHADVQYFHATGTSANVTTGSRVALSNVHNAFANIYEGRYLAGYVAGLKLADLITKGDSKVPKTGDIYIGYVGAFTYAEVISGYTSFYLGAKSVCPTVTMEVKFTGSWFDIDAEKSTAESLINNGCKLISQHADSMGAPKACEEAGVPNVSYNGSTYSECPETFIISSKIDWTPYFKYIIAQTAKGEAIAKDWCGDLKTGSVALTNIGGAAAEGTLAKLTQVRKDLAEGKIKVFDTDTFTVDGKKVESKIINEIEVIKNGVFVESDVEMYRSAPYFELNIDGINLLNTAV